MKRVAIILLLSITFLVSYSQSSQDEYTVGEIKWEQAGYPINSTATIQVIDHDMNKIPITKDMVKVHVYSDSNPEGIVIDVFETEPNSGIFEKTIFLSQTRSAPNIHHVREGDTLYAVYIDTTLPPPHLPSDQLELDASSIIDSAGPPLVRVPVSILRINDIHGNTINNLVNVEEQIKIQADLANAQDKVQSLVYIVEVYDKQEVQVFRGWIEATLGPKTAFSPEVSWTPQVTGYYMAKMMVWKALDDPTFLSPGLDTEFYVVGNMDALNENRGCEGEKELVFKTNYKKAACVFPETLTKLLGRAWATWHDWYAPLFIDNLRQGPQDIDEVHAEFVKREVMKDPQVAKHFVLLKKFDYDCCMYQPAFDSPNHYQLVITFSDLPNDKLLEVVYDLRQIKVVKTELKDMFQFVDD